MKLYNTLSRHVEPLKPLHAGQVTLYSCGPTVYDHAHIGNLSSFIFADTLRRTLQAQPLQVKHVMNYTDVDDKTIARSRERYPNLEPHRALQMLTDHYIDVFLRDLGAIGNDVQAITFIRATDAISDMHELIRSLHQGGFAYLAEDGVYFSIAAYRQAGRKYGQLTPVTVDSTSTARIDNDNYDKEAAHDFALWKKQKTGEPGWPFELGGQDMTGRPGWHIECSAMSTGLLGQPFDIHTGGVDLIFPHHENEIAQSTATTGQAYANLFAHNEHLLVDGKKMSKSLNNFYTLEDVRQRGFESLAFRMLVLQAHYRSQAQFTWENLQAAQNRLRDLQALAVLRYQLQGSVQDDTSFAFDDVGNELMQLLSDDLNTPGALAYLSDVSRQIQSILLWRKSEPHFEKMLQQVDAMLGLQLLAVPDITAAQKQLLEEREVARTAQDWAKADRLRDELAAQGIAVRDTEHGPIWSYQ